MGKWSPRGVKKDNILRFELLSVSEVMALLCFLLEEKKKVSGDFSQGGRETGQILYKLLWMEAKGHLLQGD